jgi:hypothetical protein
MAKFIELGLQLRQSLCRGLAHEEFLQGAMKSLDFALSLRVAGRAILLDYLQF